MNSPMEFYQDKRVLVTGADGLIGSSLVRALAGCGAEVTGVDRTGSANNQIHIDLPSAVWIEADLSCWLNTVGADFDQFEVIFHAAGNDSTSFALGNPKTDLHDNLLLTFELLESLRACSRPPRLINTSSAAVYGNPLHIPMRETDPMIPISPLGVSKLAGERYVDVYNLRYKIPATNLRLFPVYGPRLQSGIIYDLMEALKTNGQVLEISGDAEEMLDVIYVTDAVRAVMLAAVSAPGRGEVINVASGMPITRGELVEAVCRVCELKTEIHFTGRHNPGEPKEMAADVQRLWNMGFQPEISLESGLTLYREWFISNHCRS